MKRKLSTLKYRKISLIRWILPKISQRKKILNYWIFKDLQVY